MIGIIKNDLRPETQKPKGKGFFEKGNLVQINGGKFHDDVLWYQVDDGIEINSFEVEVDLYSGLPERHQSQFYICYRKLNAQNAPIESEVSDAPDKLYFSHLSSPSVKVNNWLPNIFANAVAQSVVGKAEKDVFVYIHGYDWQPGLKLDLAARFVQSYMNHPDSTVAKVLYFGWPSYGGRRDADDRSIEFGKSFTQKGLFRYFKLLSEALQKQGQSLNLIVHSYGHQLLNGMINPGEGSRHLLPGKIFQNIFLMAPDITHLSIQKNGVLLRNPKKTRKGRHYHYDLSPLKDLGARVHIYHNSADYLLYVSSKQSYGIDHVFFDNRPDSMGITTDYRTLGNYGKDIFDEADSVLTLEQGFNFVNVQQLVSEAGEAPRNLAFFPFRNNTNSALAEAWKGNYRNIKTLEGLFKGDLLLPHHQYLFTCKAVVDDVLRKLRHDHREFQPEEDRDIIV
ncbi:alpha/beta hydrolase [Dyadobacter sp. CY351]|uniref:alpha/beta hydrolase n=1 Tax=Dyadobacter sp. CY351 TaxID=2909337 RepID=UPI001F20D2C6|nr:alpha/beta hydrolase [Dyadobacter sp. CY351]MCF2518545.1 alpha/beta hydrolase [Dyadobacter sp. CY351]